MTTTQLPRKHLMMLWQADSIIVITLAHNNNTETRFVSSGVNVLMSNSACLSVINNALINQESGFMRFISRMVTKDECEAGVRSVDHMYDYRRNWTTRSTVTSKDIGYSFSLKKTSN